MKKARENKDQDQALFQRSSNVPAAFPQRSASVPHTPRGGGEQRPTRRRTEASASERAELEPNV